MSAQRKLSSAVVLALLGLLAVAVASATPPSLRSREITGIDFVGTFTGAPPLRSRDVTGVDFVGTYAGAAPLRSREITGVDFIGTPQ